MGARARVAPRRRRLERGYDPPAADPQGNGSQELQIAEMAATGLSNREIGQKLYLSHRTVESHLYRIFPKLGVTSRSQLRLALAETVQQ